MNEDLQRQLIRQLKVMNFWITTFGILILIALAILGYMLFQVITFVQDVNASIQEAQNAVNIQQRACDQDGSIGNYLRNQTGLCE